jgi:hypothetical protein
VNTPADRTKTKPGAVIRPGLDALLKDICFYMSPVSRSRSHKLHFVDFIRADDGAAPISFNFESQQLSLPETAVL